jgi:phage gp37-like protein
MDFIDIETAIKEAVAARMAYTKLVETYAGQLEGEMEKLPIAFPVVFVAYGGSTLTWVDGRSFNDTPVFQVIVAARDLRGPRDLKGGEYGCYRMIKDVLAAVSNETFGLEMLPMKPVKVSLIFISRTMAAYGIDFHTSFDTSFT